MKIKSLVILPALALLVMLTATGCTSYATSEQVQGLQGQVNSLGNSLNSTQQQLATSQQQLSSTQQQLNTAQQALSAAQSKQQQSTYVTSAQPVYQPTGIYGTYPYGYGSYPYAYGGYPYGYRDYRFVTPWHHSPGSPPAP